MAKKIVKKKKIKVFNLLLLILIVGIIDFCTYKYVTSDISNIIIRGNKILNDEEILKMANLENYPSFILTSSSKIKNIIEDEPYVKKVNVRKKFYHTIDINIKEYDVLFFNKTTGKYVLSNSHEFSSDKNFRVASLVNYTPDKKYKALIEEMGEVDKEILGKISEIKYQPNEFDKDRFLLLMDDGNSVYVTLTKFEMINHFNDVLGQLEGRKGILYLDSGNHFKIME